MRKRLKFSIFYRFFPHFCQKCGFKLLFLRKIDIYIFSFEVWLRNLVWLATRIFHGFKDVSMYISMRAMCFHPGIFDFHQRVTFPLWALLRNKILSAFQSFSQCFYLKKGQKFFLMFSEMFLRSSLFFTSLFGSLQKCLNF